MDMTYNFHFCLLESLFCLLVILMLWSSPLMKFLWVSPNANQLCWTHFEIYGWLASINMHRNRKKNSAFKYFVNVVESFKVKLGLSKHLHSPLLKDWKWRPIPFLKQCVSLPLAQYLDVSKVLFIGSAVMSLM